MSDKTILLTYNGTTYQVAPEAVDDLLRHGVIVADAASEGGYALSPDHVIEELEPLATVVERTDVPPRSRLHRLRVRGAGWWPFRPSGIASEGRSSQATRTTVGATDS